MTGVKKESHQRKPPKRRPYINSASKSCSSTGVDADTDANNNHHGSVRNDTLVIEVNMGRRDNDLDLRITTI